MKKIVSILLVILVAFAFVGCNLSPDDGINGTNGEEGNMDVVMHQFLGNDFSVDENTSRFIPGFTSDAQVEQTNFLIELVYDGISGYLYYQIPGAAYDEYSEYRKYKEWDSFSESAEVWIKKYEGDGEDYIGINITVFPVGSIVDHRSVSEEDFEKLAAAGLLPSAVEVIVHK